MLDADTLIFSCDKCGQKSFVNKNKLSVAKCGKCGEPFIKKSETTPQVNRPLSIRVTDEEYEDIQKDVEAHKTRENNQRGELVAQQRQESIIDNVDGILSVLYGIQDELRSMNQIQYGDTVLSVLQDIRDSQRRYEDTVLSLLHDIKDALKK